RTDALALAYFQDERTQCLAGTRGELAHIFSISQVTESLSQGELVGQLACGRVRDDEKARKFRMAGARRPFDDVRPDRNRSPAQLARQPVSLLFRKHPRA